VPKRVLSIGRDLLVLETRNLIIKSAGYEVVTAQETGGALLWLHNQHLDAAEMENLSRVLNSSRPLCRNRVRRNLTAGYEFVPGNRRTPLNFGSGVRGCGGRI
jgi:hypothetical protein